MDVHAMSAALEFKNISVEIGEGRESFSMMLFGSPHLKKGPSPLSSAAAARERPRCAAHLQIE